MAQIEHAFKFALQYFKPEFGVMFPVPAEIRQWAQEYNPEAERNSREILSRGAKPEGWEPVDPAEVQRWTDTALSNLDRTKSMEIVADKIELQKHQRAASLERLGGSTMPTPIRSTVVGEDPAVRPEAWQANREWHDGVAKKNGWKA